MTWYRRAVFMFSGLFIGLGVALRTGSRREDTAALPLFSKADDPTTSGRCRARTCRRPARRT